MVLSVAIYYQHTGKTITDFTTLVRVDLGVMAMKEYSTLPKASRLESHYQMV